MSRVRKAQQTELAKILKDIDRRMTDLVDAVQTLKDLKECATELDETLAQQEAINKNRMEEMNKKFNDNKLRAVRDAATELGKILINKEELDELQAELENIKETSKAERTEYMESEKRRNEEKITQLMDVMRLKHEAETARLKADAESHKKEVDNLNAALDRMTEELKSQKDLTARVVAPREVKVATA